MSEEKIAALESASREIETRYATILERLSNTGLILVVLGYVVYVFHLLPLSVSVQDIADNWGLSAKELAAKNLAYKGWDWITYLPGADALSLSSIALLTLTPCFCLMAAALLYIKHKDKAYIIITLLQLFVLAVAVSGFFVSGE